MEGCYLFPQDPLLWQVFPSQAADPACLRVDGVGDTKAFPLTTVDMPAPSASQT